MDLPPLDNNVIPVHPSELVAIPVYRIEEIQQTRDEPMIVQPVCRYDHGMLVKQDASYMMRKAASYHLEKPGKEKRWVGAASMFRVTLWRCTTCGYLEMFDPDPMPGEAAKA